MRILLVMLSFVMAVAVGVEAQAPAPASKPKPARTPITVYKTPTCGCCLRWVDHVRARGFAANVIEVGDLAGVRAKLGVPDSLEACHTAVVRGYAIEGHVPADVIRKLLKEKPAGVVGIAVPGMPAGSPGMEGPYKDKYNVVAFGKDGSQTVYAER